MNKDKSELTVIGVVVLVTAIVLGGLYMYDKGQSNVVDVVMNLNDSVQLKIDKVALRPGDRGRSRIIFDAVSTNLTNKEVNLLADYPTNPCSELPDEGYNKCLDTAGYTDYLKKYDEVNNQNYSEETGIKLMSPNNEYCTTNESYVADKAIKNIGYSVTQYYRSSESKIGVLVFDCSQSKGAFTLMYKDQQAQINI